MARRNNGKVIKWQVAKTVSRKDGKVAKWQVYKLLG